MVAVVSGVNVGGWLWCWCFCGVVVGDVGEVRIGDSVVLVVLI